MNKKGKKAKIIKKHKGTPLGRENYRAKFTDGTLNSETVTINGTTYSLTLDTDTNLVTALNTVLTEGATLSAAGQAIPTEEVTIVSETTAIQVGQYYLEIKDGALTGTVINSDKQSYANDKLTIGTAGRFTLDGTSYTLNTTDTEGTYSFTGEEGAIIPESVDSNNTYGGPLGQYIDSATGITTFTYTDTAGTVQNVTLNYTVVGSETKVAGFTLNDDGTFTSDTGKGITIQLTSGALADNKVVGTEINLLSGISREFHDTVKTDSTDHITTAPESPVQVMTYSFDGKTSYAFLIAAYSAADEDETTIVDMTDSTATIHHYNIYLPKEGESFTKTVDGNEVTFDVEHAIAKKAAGSDEYVSCTIASTEDLTLSATGTGETFQTALKDADGNAITFTEGKADRNWSPQPAHIKRPAD